MASNGNVVKVIRCSYSDLKALAETLEKPRGGDQKGRKGSPSKSEKKTAKPPHDEAKDKVKDSTSLNKERAIQRQQKTTADDKRKKKDISSDEIPDNSKKKAGKRISRNNNCVLNANGDSDSAGQRSSRKTVRFEVQNTKNSSETEENTSEYDRGLISTNRLLYDPTVSNDPSHSNSSRTSIKNEAYSNNELCDKIERLSTSSCPSSARTKGYENDTLTTIQEQAQSKKVNRKLAESIVAEVSHLEADLGNLLSRRINSKEQLDHATKLSSKIRERCKAIMLTDLYVFASREVYHNLWRTSVYQVIEKLRALHKSSQDDEDWTSDVSCILKEFLGSCSDFVTSLIKSLEEKHEFLLKSYLDAPNQYENCSRAVRPGFENKGLKSLICIIPDHTFNDIQWSKWKRGSAFQYVNKLGNLLKMKTLLKILLSHPQRILDLEYQDGGNELQNFIVKMALLSCHHFMIFLGDIERYKQNLMLSKDWSQARSCYLKASKIAPKNGKPYNQLAVIAVYAKRRLDAVYYYIRSLSVSNPIMTAREKLHAIFDDVQRKAYDLHIRAQMEREKLAHENEQCRSPTGFRMRNDNRSSRRCTQNSTGNFSVQDRRTTEEGRHELWVFYTSGTRREFLFTPNGLLRGQQNQTETNEKKEKTNQKISLNEINKQFEIFFLYCHAMLYSKIGIDHFLENHRKTLGLFRTLLRHPASSAVRMRRLVEIMAINMFEIENLASEDYGQVMEGTPLDLALNLGCDMFLCLCKATSDIIKSSDDGPDQDAYHVPVLTNYVPAVKVWFDWMQKSISMLRSSSVSIKEEFWSGISVFLNTLSRKYELEKTAPAVPGEIVLTLPEDDHLNGFNLLAQSFKPRSGAHSDSEKEMVYRLLRKEALQKIAIFLCEFEDLPLRFDESSRSYYVTDIMTSAPTEENQEIGNEIDEDEIEDDVIIESVEDIYSDDELPSPVKELKAKKDALTKEILNQKQREEEAQAVLVEHSSKPTLVLEINPQYLVPDTNCFIDHLPGLQYIVESRHFTFVIPLVVINELDGLAKGVLAADTEQQQRADYVANQARAAVDFLEYRFSLTDSQMLALTSKGSVLTTIAFRSEEPTAGMGINDDIILNCCTHYCDAKMDVVNKLATADQPFTMRRKVVLLTDDRNLRLKAHVQNIPVVAVPQFLEMIFP